MTGKFKKIWWIFLLMILILGVFIYMHVVPIICTFMSYGLFEGTEYYTSGEYVNFEHGAAYDSFLGYIAVPEEAEPIDFFHHNRSYRDHLYHGPAEDYYCLDLRLSRPEITVMKERISADPSFVEETAGKYFVLIRFEETDQWTNAYIFAIHESKPIIRCAMVADMDELDDWRGEPIFSKYIDWRN